MWEGFLDLGSEIPTKQQITKTQSSSCAKYKGGLFKHTVSLNFTLMVTFTLKANNTIIGSYSHGSPRTGLKKINMC